MFQSELEKLEDLIGSVTANVYGSCRAQNKQEIILLMNREIKWVTLGRNELSLIFLLVTYHTNINNISVIS